MKLTHFTAILYFHCLYINENIQKCILLLKWKGKCTKIKQIGSNVKGNTKRGGNVRKILVHFNIIKRIPPNHDHVNLGIM